MDESFKKKLLKLTWDDLTTWTSGRTVTRGKGYVSNVENMVEMPDGAIVACVHGGMDYLTRIYLKSDGTLDSKCSCPVGSRCKHAIALILVAAKRLNSNKDIDCCDIDSAYYQKIKSKTYNLDLTTDARDKPSKVSVVDTYLRKLNGEAALEILKELVNEIPEVRPYLREKIELSNTKSSQLVKIAKKVIKDASTGYYDAWNHFKFPDYSKVEKCFRKLDAIGDWKSLRDLGFDLLEQAQHQIECSNDEGEFSYHVENCLAIVTDAITKSPLSPIEKAKWSLEFENKDLYSFSDVAMARFFAKDALSKTEWSEIADFLIMRYKDCLNAADVESSCEQNRLCDKISRALEYADRLEDMVKLRIDSLEKTHDYPELVQLLIQLNRPNEAAEWCLKGIRAIEEKWPYKSNSLRRSLQSIAEKDGNMSLVAAYEAQFFFEWPSFEHYETLRTKCRKSGDWKTVHMFILGFLENGKRPEGMKGWPFPKLNCPMTNKPQYMTFPNYELLTKIALSEKRYADAIRWFKAGNPDLLEFMGWKVAKAIKKEFPNEALAIWRQLIKTNCTHVAQYAYDVIARAYSEMRPVMKGLKQEVEWQNEVLHMRETYKRRKNLVALLDGLLSKNCTKHVSKSILD